MLGVRPKNQEDWDALRAEITDAFSPSAPVQEKDLFAGRANQMLALEDAVNQRGRHAILYGERGVGKTSLANILHLVMRRPNKELIYVRVNADPTDTFTSLWKKVFKRMNYVVNTSSGDSVKAIAEDFPGALTPDDVQMVLAEFSGNQVPIIVLDEFDRISDRSATQLVADTIKALSDYSVSATLVLVGVAEDVSTLIQGHESITRSLVQVKMPRMSTDELKQIIVTRYKRCGITTDVDAVWKMIYLSRGLPNYTHLLAMHSATYCVDHKRLTVTHKDVDAALERSVRELDQSNKEKYMAAIRSQRGEETLYPSVLLACALAPTDELGRFQQSAVTAPLNKLNPGKNYQAATFALHMNSLCMEERGQVLQKFGTPRNYRYRFTDPMLQPYVILKALSEGTLDDSSAEIFSTKSQMAFSI